MTTYRITNWDSLFENNRTKDMVKMRWVPVPNRHDGDGYTALVDRKNGAALLGAWLVILQVASKCDPRGTLLREGGKPHDAGSIARMTRLPASIIQEAIDVCLTETHWLECETLTEIPQEGAAIPQEGAAIPQATDYGKEGKGMEGTEGKEQKGREPRFAPPSLDEVKLVVAKAGLPENDAIWFFHKGEGNGWTNNGKPMKSWQHTVAAWKAGNYFPSQKQLSRPAFVPRSDFRPPPKPPKFFRNAREQREAERIAAEVEAMTGPVHPDIAKLREMMNEPKQDTQ